MLSSAGFAFLVMTGEDMHDDNELHARENVIHEIGLFQGKLVQSVPLSLWKKVALSFPTSEV